MEDSRVKLADRTKSSIAVLQMSLQEIERLIEQEMGQNPALELGSAQGRITNDTTHQSTEYPTL